LIALNSSADEPYGQTSSDEIEKATYFLIDISGSMAHKDAEGRVSEILDPLKEQAPGALVSRTYFRAKDGKACWNSIAVGGFEPASDSKPLSFDFGNDFTPLGEALKAALLDAVARGGSSDIYIISDEDPTPGCGIDVCAVADAYLPLTGINVTSVQVDEDALSRRDRIGCIEAAEARPAAAKNAVSGGEPSKADLSSWSLWENSGWWERWTWLCIFIVAVLSAVIFTVRVILMAHAYEKRSEEIQERQRALLTGQGDRDDHNKHISLLSEYEGPKEPVLRGIGWGFAIFALLLTCILVFTEDRFLGLFPLDDRDRLLFVDLAPARKLSWLVLSSGFSNAFAIIGITPILFMSAQNWRLMQAKRTFTYVSGLAAEQEAKKRNQEIDDLFNQLNSVRSTIPNAKLSARWADPPKQYSWRNSWRTVPDKFSDEDRNFLLEIKRRLLEFAQVPKPSKEGQTPKTLMSQIEDLSEYAPRSMWRAPWTLEALICDLNSRGWINVQAVQWLQFAQQIEDRDYRKIKVSLKELATYQVPDA
jgi:hypothetical protein